MIKELDKDILKRLFISGAHHLDNNKQAVNDLNVFPVPDGDTGTNMSHTMLNAEKMLLEKECSTAGEVAAVVANATLRGARGNSGVILSQIMRGFASALQNCEKIMPEDFVRALDMAAKTAYRAVMKPTEGTILTVIRSMAEVAERLDDDGDMCSLLEAVVQYGNIALDNTPKLLPVLKKAGVVDAGGKGLMLIFEGMMLSLIKDAWIERQENEEAVAAPLTVGVQETLKYTYCTEFIVKKSVAAASAEELKKEIAPRGDSVLVIDDEDVIKVHIHTNHPGMVLERGLSFGMLSDIKIDNLKEQQEENKAVQKEENKPAGVIAVAAGDGIADLFRELGADVVIHGGQTMNPSTEDILEAIENLCADTIFVLPNNGNIILAAEQAVSITEKNVQVIKTKTIPEGIAALMAFDGPKAAEAMAEAAAGVMTGLLTYAVRDTDMDGLQIKEGDFLSLVNGSIVAAKAVEDEAMAALCDALVTDETYAVTLLYGEGETEESAKKYADRIAEKWPDAEVTVIYGGQPVYRFMVSAE